METVRAQETPHCSVYVRATGTVSPRGDVAFCFSHQIASTSTPPSEHEETRDGQYKASSRHTSVVMAYLHLDGSAGAAIVDGGAPRSQDMSVW